MKYLCMIAVVMAAWGGARIASANCEDQAAVTNNVIKFVCNATTGKCLFAFPSSQDTCTYEHCSDMCQFNQRLVFSTNDRGHRKLRNLCGHGSPYGGVCMEFRDR